MREQAITMNTPRMAVAVRPPLCPPWTRFTHSIHHALTACVTACALQAARRPKTWITCQTLLSLGLVAAGLASGRFRLELDIMAMFNPLDSLPQQHSDWIAHSPEAFGDYETRVVLLFLHNDGGNVLHVAQTRRVLQAVQTMHETPGLPELCAQGTYLNFDNEPTCRLLSVSGYWPDHYSLADFDAHVPSDEDLRTVLASNQLANGSPIIHDALLGNWNKTTISTVQLKVEDASSLSFEWNNNNSTANATNATTTNATTTIALNRTVQTSHTIMSSAQSYFVRLDLPEQGDVSDLVEEELINRLDRLRLQWIDEDAAKPFQDPTALSMDIKSAYAYQMETMKLIQADLYLVVIAALVVVLFTCLVFYRHDDNGSDNHNHKSSKSRCLLGVASIGTITMSLLAGCGVMFLAGIPYTSVNQMLPYIIYGIGLDDTFIITGAFFQLDDDDDDGDDDTNNVDNDDTHDVDDPSTSSSSRQAIRLERKIEKTLQQVGWSICLTTLTTVVAFLLGYCSSSFPGVRWLCLYAVTIITIDFFYQVTYFVAWLVLDEQRIQANRRDCCFCFTNTTNAIQNGPEDDNNREGLVLERMESTEDDDFDLAETAEDVVQDANDVEETIVFHIGRVAKDYVMAVVEDVSNRPVGVVKSIHNYRQPARKATSAAVQKSLPERVMQWYSNFLLRPPVKVAVLVIFTLFFAACCYSATLLEQHFDMNDYVADTSFLKTAYGNIGKYSSIVREMQVYFRNVDQTSPEVQQQMINYVNDLESLPQIGTSDVSLSDLSESGEVRPFCWVRDFQEWESTQYADQPAVLEVLANMTFIEKLNFALKDKTVREVYGQDIVRDKETGNITASRCTLFLRHLDVSSVPEQIDMLMDQREVTKAQPINNLEEHRKNWAFFSFDILFFFWESSAVVINEMIFTTIAGVVAVAFGKFGWSNVDEESPMNDRL